MKKRYLSALMSVLFAGSVVAADAQLNTPANASTRPDNSGALPGNSGHGGGDPRAQEALNYGKQIVGWLLNNPHPEVEVDAYALLGRILEIQKSLDTLTPLMELPGIEEIACFGASKKGCTDLDASIELAGRYWDNPVTTIQAKCALSGTELFRSYQVQENQKNPNARQVQMIYDDAMSICQRIYPDAQGPSKAGMCTNDNGAKKVFYHTDCVSGCDSVDIDEVLIYLNRMPHLRIDSTRIYLSTEVSEKMRGLVGTKINLEEYGCITLGESRFQDTFSSGVTITVRSNSKFQAGRLVIPMQGLTPQDYDALYANTLQQTAAYNAEVKAAKDGRKLAQPISRSTYDDLFKGMAGPSSEGTCQSKALTIQKFFTTETGYLFQASCKKQNINNKTVTVLNVDVSRLD